MKAAGNVKSELQPASKGTAPGESGNDVKMPSMLKQDQPVNVTADALDYDGARRRTATYTGARPAVAGRHVDQGRDDRHRQQDGDLTASGGVTTTTIARTGDKDKKKERVRSIATSKDFKYEDVDRAG